LDAKDVKMTKTVSPTYSYFPGCSMATTAKENNASLVRFFGKMGIDLRELEDWNCCGSSSVHCLDTELSVMLPARNLALAPSGRPLLVACPNCLLRLKTAQMQIGQDAALQATYAEIFGRPFDPGLQILHVFDLLDHLGHRAMSEKLTNRLDGLRFAAYYGCMLARPPALRHEPNHFGLMERILARTGARSMTWGYASRCCGTFLSVVRPDLVTAMVNDIVAGARASRADCIVTACAMCHLNLEVRCTLPDPIPIMHFSELLAMAAGDLQTNAWFKRHLIDPRPILKKTGVWTSP
jgi:heterodisulfide reductase subunit B2